MNDLTKTNYFELKSQYKQKIKKLLLIRKGFTKKLEKDTLQSITTMNDEVDENKVEYSKYRAKEKRHSKK